MSDWRSRLVHNLEPILKLEDPHPKISSYHNMPYAIFWYPPEDEFALRKEVTLLSTRLEMAGKRVTVISLAKCLDEALKRSGMTVERMARAERMTGTEKMCDTIHSVLSSREPLDALVAEFLPPDPQPLLDIVFITRAGALFPFYRTSSLMEQLQGKVLVPSVLFYPGSLDGAAGLRFMDILDAEHNYRPLKF